MSYADPETNWDAGTYDRFRRLRLRPALDLLAQVPDVPEGDIVDLGCGTGAVAHALRHRYPKRPLIGIDRSADMVAGILADTYDRVQIADIAQWRPDVPVALIFSNAALHWLPDHPLLFPRLASALKPGGVLAVQMPRQFDAPSHRLIHEVARDLFPDRFERARTPPVAAPSALYDICADLGDVTIWETDYLQHLPTQPDDAHPVRAFTRSTAARPILAKLTSGEQERFFHAYDAALEAVYSRRADGSVLFGFRRQFLILQKA